MEGFSAKPSTPFFICLYFIGAGRDENLKITLAWPSRSVCTLQIFYYIMHVKEMTCFKRKKDHDCDFTCTMADPKPRIIASFISKLKFRSILRQIATNTVYLINLARFPANRIMSNTTTERITFFRTKQ